MRPVTGGPAQPNVFRESGGRGLPTRTFTDRMTLGSGNERDRSLLLRPRAHRRRRVGRVPGAWRAAQRRRVRPQGRPAARRQQRRERRRISADAGEGPRALTDIETVVTGHYPATLKMDDLRTYGDFVREFVQEVQAAKRAGRTIDDFVDGWTLPERYRTEGTCWRPTCARCGRTSKWSGTRRSSRPRRSRQVVHTLKRSLSRRERLRVRGALCRTSPRGRIFGGQPPSPCPPAGGRGEVRFLPRPTRTNRLTTSAKRRLADPITPEETFSQAPRTSCSVTTGATGADSAPANGGD